MGSASWRAIVMAGRCPSGPHAIRSLDLLLDSCIPNPRRRSSLSLFTSTHSLSPFPDQTMSDRAEKYSMHNVPPSLRVKSPHGTGRTHVLYTRVGRFMTQVLWHLSSSLDKKNAGAPHIHLRTTSSLRIDVPPTPSTRNALVVPIAPPRFSLPEGGCLVRSYDKGAI